MKADLGTGRAVITLFDPRVDESQNKEILLGLPPEQAASRNAMANSQDLDDIAACAR